MTLTVLIDPELALPEDARAFIYAERISVFGSYSATFTNFQDMLNHRQAVERSLKAEAVDWQRNVAPPCHVRRVYLPPDGPEVTIYARIFTADEVFDQERARAASVEEASRTAYRVTDALTRGWLYGRFYSTLVTEGEFGCVHRAQVSAVVPSVEFEGARTRGWKP